MKRKEKTKTNGGIQKILDEIKIGISGMFDISEKVNRNIAEQHELIVQVLGFKRFLGCKAF